MEKKAQNTLPNIRQTLVFNNPVRYVWDGVDTSEGLAAWFMPNDILPVSGHEFDLNAGYDNAGKYGTGLGRIYIITGRKRAAC